MDDDAQPAALQRVLLKLSGEALAGDAPFGVQPDAVMQIVDELRPLIEQGVQLGIVIGGGNIFRGLSPAAAGMDRATADNMGMLATVMNALALRDAMEKSQLACRVMSALRIDGIAEPFVRARALAHLRKGRVVVFAGGTGNPYFTTDTAACVRAIDIQAQVVLKATKVDGVYSADPLRDPAAVRYDRLSYDEVLARRLGVMDATAIAMCREHGLPIRVFNMHESGALAAIAAGRHLGTHVGSGDADGLGSC